MSTRSTQIKGSITKQLFIPLLCILETMVVVYLLVAMMEVKRWEFSPKTDDLNSGSIMFQLNSKLKPQFPNFTYVLNHSESHSECLVQARICFSLIAKFGDSFVYYIFIRVSQSFESGLWNMPA